LVRATREDVAQRVQENLEQIRSLERQVRSLQDRLASGQGTDLAGSAVDVSGVKVVATQLIGADATALRNAVDQLKAKLQSAVVVLASIAEGDRITLVAGVTQDLTSRLKAGEIIAAVATQVGGKGGGRPDFAQAGGTDVKALGTALASVLPWVRSRLS
jgi:alanyl-tRNA synthetase